MDFLSQMIPKVIDRMPLEPSKIEEETHNKSHD